MTKDVYKKLLQGGIASIVMNLKENRNKILLTKQSKQPTIAKRGKQQRRFCTQLSLILMIECVPKGVYIHKTLSDVQQLYKIR